MRGAAGFAAEALNTAKGAGCSGAIVLRADAKFYTADIVAAARRVGAFVSLTTGSNPSVNAAIAAIAEEAWTPIHYRHAFVDEDTGELISDAEVAEIPYTAFAAKPKHLQAPGRLIVRRVKRLSPRTGGRGELFDVHRHHAVFTTSPYLMLIWSPNLGVFAVSAAGVLCAFSCVADALPGQCLRRRPSTNPLVAAVFRTKRPLREHCSATCQRRRRPGQARHRQGRLQIKLVQAGEQHRDHAVVEQVLADWTDGPLAHLPEPPGRFPPTRPGSPWRLSATTCCAPPGPWPASPAPGPAAPRCAAT